MLVASFITVGIEVFAGGLIGVELVLMAPNSIADSFARSRHSANQMDPTLLTLNARSYPFALPSC